MKRDMDLVRALLFKLEEKPAGDDRLLIRPAELDINDLNDATLTEHLRLMIEANESKAIGAALPIRPRRLTWRGHDFLERVRSDTTWEKTKAVANEKGIGLTVDSLAQIAGTLAGLALKALGGG
ncbi:MAG: DUF2513 domain-containing protein [Pseudomonadota bacterium]